MTRRCVHSNSPINKRWIRSSKSPVKPARVHEQVLLWQYPDSDAAPVIVKTQHLANIFGVRFLPCSGDRRLVTGAMDSSVQLHVLDASPSRHVRTRRERQTVRWVPDDQNEPVSSHSTKYLCHSKRVKVCKPPF